MTRISYLLELGEDKRLLPHYEAISALEHGDRRRLLNVPFEARAAAEAHFDEMEKVLNALPAKTRRRPIAAPPPKTKGRNAGGSRS